MVVVLGSWGSVASRKTEVAHCTPTRAAPATEPCPWPQDTSGKTAAAAAVAADPPPYDQRRFQDPRPDDRDGGGAGKSKANTKTTETKASKDISGKAAADGSHCCYHCGTGGVPETLLVCV